MVQEHTQTLWYRISNSRLLASIGVVAILLVGGFTITSLASAQGVTYTTLTTLDLTTIRNQIQSLFNRVATLETQVRVLQSAPRQTLTSAVITNPPVPTPTYVNTINTGYPIYPTYNPPTYPTYPNIQPVTNTGTVVNRPVIIDQNGGTYVEGFDIYFTGRGFTPYEQILITRNGQLVGHVNSDASGNISSGGVFLPLGTHAFVFSGQTSGVVAVATVRGVDSVVTP
jgi:hypothetical protein